MSVNPDQQFPGKQEGEKVSVFARRHWLFFLPDMLIFALGLVMPIVILILLRALEADTSGSASVVIALGVPAFYLSLFTWFYIRWLDYYLDLAVATDRRVIDIDQHGLFRRTVSELEHEVVQDVSVEKNGILATLLNVGNVVIQTAGERPNFTFATIGKPEEVATQISYATRATGESDESMVQAAEKMEEAASKLEQAAAAGGVPATPPAASEPEPPSTPEATAPSQPDPPTEPTDPPSDTPAGYNPPVDPTPAADDLPREYQR